MVALNELEYIPGANVILANLWYKNFIVAIEPESGLVYGYCDMTSDHLIRIHGRYATLHVPCGVLYLVSMRIRCVLVVETRCSDLFTSSRTKVPDFSVLKLQEHSHSGEDCFNGIVYNESVRGNPLSELITRVPRGVCWVCFCPGGRGYVLTT